MASECFTTYYKEHDKCEVPCISISLSNPSPSSSSPGPPRPRARTSGGPPARRTPPSHSSTGARGARASVVLPLSGRDDARQVAGLEASVYGAEAGYGRGRAGVCAPVCAARAEAASARSFASCRSESELALRCMEGTGAGPARIGSGPEYSKGAGGGRPSVLWL